MAKATNTTTTTTTTGQTVARAAQGTVQAANQPLPNCAASRQVGSKPTAHNQQYIAKITGVATKGLRPKRWANYKVGQTLLHCANTPGLDPLDVQFYVANKLMVLGQPTAKQLQAAQAAWLKAQAKA